MQKLGLQTLLEEVRKERVRRGIKVQNRTINIMGLLIILISGSGIIVWADSEIPSVHSTDDLDGADMTQDEVFRSGISYSIPRDQVLLEIATGTW